MKKTWLLLTLITFIFLCSILGLQSVWAAQGNSNNPAGETTERKEPFGVDWGVGLSATFDTGGKKRVKSATVVNGIVRITDEDNIIIRPLLETHYMLRFRWFSGAKTDMVGWGPWIGIQLGSDENLIDALGGGVMLLLARTNADQKIIKVFSLGAGLMLDPHTQVLGDGIEENQPLPSGETEIRYKSTTQTGVVIVFSASF